ncbi:MAG: acetyl-CoA C-acyltransferase [Planktotalea sp.]|jgi:acetyl-CoA C-acetyltransferase|uniref:acetyl-CoA C-acyltransferase n=1 Tax=Planktotalea sp. TaxID=2029877 RepID=UPI0002FA62D9|nr:acetyl-CoA C-acyltransferase [Planktotalea sp.]MBT5821613.1 acetyl-CoA C-acyltransferase [Paracoccaceae bacterium]MDG1075106.1 acetyl-CoA C-acyltransferase [Planktotalea sp.]MDG1085411.1 acetyl-CoA C-acyltransferase [Planktotalea sp.]HCW84488.1 acetyl-CoA C-acyltransferase [Paracoccaceae bacterium]
MTAVDPIVIVSTARTPMGGFQGDFASVPAAHLGSAAIKAAVVRVDIAPEDVEEVAFGNVLSAGQGQAPARQAALGAGLPLSATCTTLNKMCGSGMKAAMYAHDMLVAGSAEVIVAGGMESMSNAPYLMPKAREGLRMGHAEMKDHMFFDGLEDAYDKGRLMGTFAEDCAESFQFTREAQDDYAFASLDRAIAAIEGGKFDSEVTPVTLKTRAGDAQITTDEQPAKAKRDKIRALRPAFRKDGTVTAANSSSISDGAAAIVMMRASEAEKRGLTPLARMVGHVSFADKPGLFPTAPIGSLTKLSEKTGWALRDVDLYEINEAFAVVPMAAMRALDLPHDKVNIHGGACALGHPIGASAARIMVTLIGALQANDMKRGIASVCIGGGEATAVALEMMQ